MECKNAHKRIVEFIQDELPSVQNKEIKEHLKVCDNCKKEMEEIEIVLGLSKEVKIPEFSEDFWALQRNKLPYAKRAVKLSLKLTIALTCSFILLGSFLLIQFRNSKIASYKRISNVLVLEDSLLPPEEQIYELINFMNDEDSEIVMQMLLKK